MMASSGFKSFNLSLIFHALLLVIFSLFVNSKENVEMIQKRTLISMDLGPLGNTGSLSPKTREVNNSAHAEKKMPKTSSMVKGEKIEKSNPQGSENGNTVANESAIGNGNGSGSIAGDSQSFSSSILNFREPIYPKMAIRRGLQGTVKVRIKINSEGVPVETTLLKSSGFEILDQSAISAARNWLFVKRENVSFYFVEKNIVFELEK